ncbi:MAG TPA: hypothetical protein VKS98_06790 [Chthoniobacterales bacterium]|nr:hypothetical protein [Chthoniobacterales bacterium]
MDLSPQEQSIVRRFSQSNKSPIAGLMRSSMYCVVLAGLFLYLALARNEPLYSIGIFGMFVVYLAIRVYSARRISGIMPRILEQYELRISELEARLGRIEGANPEENKGR